MPIASDPRTRRTRLGDKIWDTITVGDNLMLFLGTVGKDIPLYTPKSSCNPNEKGGEKPNA